MPGLSFKGIAHPAAREDGQRDHSADMSSGEITATNLGRRGGTDLLYEHNHADRVGHVTSSWRGVGGELRVSGVVHDKKMIERMRSGHSRGLSLGSSVTTDMDGARVMATQDELSLCVEPRRGGCYVDEIDGKRVLRSHRASAGAPPTPLPQPPRRPPSLAGAPRFASHRYHDNPNSKPSSRSRARTTMSETATPAAEPGVVPSSLDAGKAYSEEYVNDLKARLEDMTKREASANAGLAAHKERQRMALKGMQAEVQSFVNEAYELAPDDQKHDVEPMRKFAESLGEAENPDSALPLARVICLSSSKFKRDRSEFSKSSEAAEQLAAANKQIDELTADRDGKQSRIAELEALADERQTAAEKLQAELAKIGVVSEKFDFSKAAAREEGGSSTAPPSAPSSVPSAPSAPMADPLLSFLSGGSSAGGRLMPSGTNHGYLGQVAGSSSDGGVAEALRNL